MYLKNLQLVGFKSFAEKTSLEFLPGVTAVVGPNGCGKSNVSDAIRWVLGEQSAKALRGGEMADVIFNGTDNRKPIGMAEVSLTISDVNTEQLRAAGVSLEYNEVTVSRRVYRDGHGEYFINKTPVRLRDIQQLFMDTGVGRSSYSMMAQGQIDQILSAHPDDRRMIFEEAAGITKFKSQKKEALRKLEHTEANLVRLADIIREVKRQIGSLQRQAGKARRYRELHDQLKMLETKLARHQYDELIEQVKANQAQADAFGQELAEATRKAEAEDAQLSATRRSLEELEQQTNEVVHRGMEIQAGTERHNNRVQFNRERIAELAAQNERARAEIAAAEEKVLVQQRNLAEIEDQLRQLEEVLAREEKQVADSTAAVREVESQIEQGEAETDTLKNRSIELESESAHLRNELSSLDTQQRNATLRLERLTAEKNALADQRGQLAQKREGFRAGIAEQRAQVGEERTRWHECRRRFEEASREWQAAHAQWLEQTQQLEAERSRLQLWQHLAANLEEIAEGSRILLQRAGEFGVAGALAHAIQVGPEHAVAVEAALGQSLHSILVEDADKARSVIDAIRGQKMGRATLVAKSWSAPDASRPAAPEWSRGCVAGHVRCDDALRPVIERLLGQVLLVDSVGTALANLTGDWDMVTLEGEWIGRNGVIVGGACPNGASGPLMQQNKISECQANVRRLAAAVDSWKQKVTGLETAKQSLESEIAERGATVHKLELALASREGEFNILERECQEATLRVETVEYELHSLGAQDGAQTGRRQEILDQVSANEATQKELHARLGENEQRTSELEDQRRQAADRLTEAKIAFATKQQQRGNLLGQKQPAEARVAELREGIAHARAAIVANDQRGESLRQEIAESETELERFKVERIEVDRILGERTQRRQEINSLITQQEEQIRALHRHSSEIQQRKNEIDIKLSELRMTINHLKERIHQKYQVNLEDVRGEGFVITIAESGKPEIHEVSASEAQQAGVNVTHWDEVQQQVVELQSRLDAMGPVNLGAVEEFEELEQRHKFLSEQQDDLVKSKEQLLQVLSKINSTTKQMFVETFEKIKANFQEMFTELFGGGKANLLLVDEGDVLESGIEIVARPPGKQLQSISLLSGGERTMTAVALLFSIYMVKPSPFCVLDELDAPLDESNINRFIKILQRFLQQSQFIIITHNKRTIAMADALYGVTMEEHGISKIVSVKFRKHVETTPAAEAKLEVKALPGESPVTTEETDEVVTDAHVPATHVEEPPSPEEMAKLREQNPHWHHGHKEDSEEGAAHASGVAQVPPVDSTEPSEKPPGQS